VARDIVLGLTLTVLLVVALLGISYGVITNRSLSQDLQARAGQLIAEVADVLYFPLLNLDNQTIRHSAGVYLESNDYIAGITVRTDFGETVIDRRPEYGWQLSRTRILKKDGREIGSVSLYFNDGKLLTVRRNTIRTALVLTLVIIGIMVVCVNLFLHYWLNRPFERLIMGIRRIASGDYDNPLPAPPQTELAAITHEVNIMARQIAAKNEELARSEKKYRSIFNGAQEGIFQISVNGRFLTANPAMARIFGYDSPEELMRNCTDIAGQIYVDPMNHQELINRLRRGEVVSRFTTRFRHRAGHVLQVSLNARGIPGPDGDLQYIEGMLEDITEQRKMEDNLRQAQKMEAIGTLAGGIAHDFNNILFAIFGYLELAQSQAGNNRQLMNNLARALEGAKRARDLVRQILTVSRKAAREVRPIRAADIVIEALGLLRSSIPATVDIRQEIDSTAIILADPTQIHQVVMNLCTNSYHALGEVGGTVRITLRDVTVGGNSVAAIPDLAPGRYVLLEVRDTGCGMDEETRAKIFEPYFTSKEQGKGTGLGLAMVHGIVESYQGRITVHSRPGEGSLFRIFLPAAETGEATGAGEREVPRIGGGGRERIMLVDDEPMIRALLREYLATCGYRVAAFADGETALAAFAREPGAWDLGPGDHRHDHARHDRHRTGGRDHADPSRPAGHPLYRLLRRPEPGTAPGHGHPRLPAETDLHGGTLPARPRGAGGRTGPRIGLIPGHRKSICIFMWLPIAVNYYRPSGRNTPYSSDPVRARSREISPSTFMTRSCRSAMACGLSPAISSCMALRNRSQTCRACRSQVVVKPCRAPA